MDTTKRIIWKPETRKLTDLKPYKKNPRIIDEFGLKQLEQSFDEIGMMQPLAINTDNTILSGHARWMQLSKENSEGDVLVMVPDRMLTDKQEEAVIIRANKNITGRWDFNILANEFDLSELMDWGFNANELGNFNVEQVENLNKNELWEGMPEFQSDDQLAHKKLIVNFATDHHFEEFFKIIGQSFTDKTKFIWYPAAEKKSTLDEAYE